MLPTYKIKEPIQQKSRSRFPPAAALKVKVCMPVYGTVKLAEPPPPIVEVTLIVSPVVQFDGVTDHLVPSQFIFSFAPPFTCR